LLTYNYNTLFSNSYKIIIPPEFSEKKHQQMLMLEFVDKPVLGTMVNRFLRHIRTGDRLFAMMQKPDNTIVPKTYFSTLSSIFLKIFYFFISAKNHKPLIMPIVTGCNLFTEFFLHNHEVDNIAFFSPDISQGNDLAKIISLRIVK